MSILLEWSVNALPPDCVATLHKIASGEDFKVLNSVIAVVCWIGISFPITWCELIVESKNLIFSDGVGKLSSFSLISSTANIFLGKMFTWALPS